MPGQERRTGHKIMKATHHRLVPSCTSSRIPSTTQVCRISIAHLSIKAYGCEAIDVHQYFEEGGDDVCSISTPVAYAPLTAWLKQYGYKAMVTEWGSPNGTQCATYVRDMLNYVADNSEVCHKYVSTNIVVVKHGC